VLSKGFSLFCAVICPTQYAELGFVSGSGSVTAGNREAGSWKHRDSGGMAIAGTGAPNSGEKGVKPWKEKCQAASKVGPL
jgi:hypothetical protein